MIVWYPKFVAEINKRSISNPMDDFNFDEFLDLLPGNEDQEPEKPVRDGIILPEEVKWADKLYNYADLEKLPHLAARAYHITTVELKHIQSKNLWLLVLNTHVGEEKHWYNPEEKMTKQFNLFYKYLFSNKETLEAGTLHGNWVAIRQTIEYPKWNAVHLRGCFKAENAQNIPVTTEEEWEAEQEAREMDYQDAWALDDSHPGHPNNYYD